jgi:hypothetical protein
MKISENILKIISSIADRYPQIELYYEYKSSSYTHFVKIIPKDVLENEDFIAFATKLEDEYYQTVKDESDICFISDDSITQLSSAALSLLDILKPEHQEIVINWNRENVINLWTPRENTTTNLKLISFPRKEIENDNYIPTIFKKGSNYLNWLTLSIPGTNRIKVLNANCYYLKGGGSNRISEPIEEYGNYGLDEYSKNYSCSTPIATIIDSSELPYAA